MTDTKKTPAKTPTKQEKPKAKTAERAAEKTGAQETASDGTETIRRTEYERSGDILRAKCTARGLSVEDVSSAINIRAAQIRAIEEGHIEALPGMVYAQGFVKSYAQFLSLDGAALAAKFKAEHAGELSERPKLNFPEPLDEDKLPGALIVGVAGLCVILVLIAWGVLSGEGREEFARIAGDIPPAVTTGTPVTQTAVEKTLTIADTDTSSGTESLTQVAASAFQPAPQETAPALSPDVAAATAAPAPQVAAPIPAAPQVATLRTEEPQVAETPAAVPQDMPAAAPETAATQQPAAAPVPPRQERLGGRHTVVISAVRTAWIQVSDAGGQIIYKKVLRAGERYNVPNERGLTMVTSNAGGLEIYVRGEKTPPIGRVGDIVRGVSLDADDLTRPRIRVRGQSR